MGCGRVFCGGHLDGVYVVRVFGGVFVFVVVDL